MRALTAGHGVDVVVDCVGAPPTVALARAVADAPAAYERLARGLVRGRAVVVPSD